MNYIIRYEVYDKKNRWMGGYSTELDNAAKSSSSFDMAKINAVQSNGQVLAIFNDGSKSQVYPK